MGGGLLAGSLCVNVGCWGWNLVCCGVFSLAQQPPLTGPSPGHWESGMKGKERKGEKLQIER